MIARQKFTQWTAESRVDTGLLAATFAALVVGGALWLAGRNSAADLCWAIGTIIAIVPALVWVLAALRRGRAGVDLIAVLALVGTLAVGEYLAGALIALMLATGRSLESAAQRRASRELRALREHVPRTARLRRDEQLSVVPLDSVVAGDVVVVGPGEVVGVDGRITSGTAVLDESVLTGESVPVEYGTGETVRSGSINAGAAFEMSASAPAAEGTYAGIVRLADEAGAEQAPVVRLADRYAAWFLPLSLLVAGAAWLFSGSASRAVAVLVVATPCPLLLAAPVAIVAGLSRAAHRGVVVRDGAALERLAAARTLVVDKTGTLTVGRPTVVDVIPAQGWDGDEVLRLAAAVDQVSPHVLARAIVQEATVRGLTLPVPADVTERPGQGAQGTIADQRVGVGKVDLPESLPDWARTAERRAVLDGAALVWLCVDGDVKGAILLRDRLRTDAPRTLRRLRAAGLQRLVMLTGDRAEPAREVATVLGLDGVLVQQTPQDKVNAVRAEGRRAVTVMVGDGVNDAPALAAATVGVAIGGAAAASESADVVLAADRLDRLADAMDIARRSRSIAIQSAVVGMGLSLVAMVIAALGWLPAAAGALLQEGIDVAVIINALRALRAGSGDSVQVPEPTASLLRRFAAEHGELRAALPMIRDAADVLSRDGATPQATERLREVHRFLSTELLPHEHAEETELYPALARPLGSAEATATMSRMHAEIDRLSQRLGALLDAGPDGDPEDLLACLYGLYTVLCLHFAQEEESYFALIEDDRDPVPPT